MVQPEDLLQRLRQRPFEAFSIYLEDGRTFELHYPDMHIVGKTFLMLGIPEIGEPDPFADRFEMIGLSQIHRIEPIPNARAIVAE